MGTSSAGKGAAGRTPLVPSWADEPPPTATGEKDIGSIGPSTAVPTVPPKAAEPPLGTAERWREARSSFTRYATSGGTRFGPLATALTEYIGRSLGGSATAARRMGVSSGTAERLAGVLGELNARGTESTLRRIGLADLVGQPATEVLVGLLAYLCPDGGTLDEAISREAYLQAVVECAVGTDIEEGNPFTEERAVQILESFVTHSICLRVINDIGTRAQDVAPSIATATHVEEQLFVFVRGAVHDALDEVRSGEATLDDIRATILIDALYPSVWELLLELAKSRSEE